MIKKILIGAGIIFLILIGVWWNSTSTEIAPTQSPEINIGTPEIIHDPSRIEVPEGEDLKPITIEPDGTVTDVVTIDSTHVAVSQKKNQLFPDFQPSPLTFKTIGEGSVQVTRQPKGLIELDVRPTFGVEVGSNVRPTIGVNVLRVGPAYFGGALSYRDKLYLSGTTGIQVFEHLMIDARLNTELEPSVGVVYRF